MTFGYVSYCMLISLYELLGYEVKKGIQLSLVNLHLELKAMRPKPS